jgi:hypothetical protein
MSTHKVNDGTWNALIEGAEETIQTCRDRIKDLKKSIVFFKKQKEAGAPFPIEIEQTTNTHQELS